MNEFKTQQPVMWITDCYHADGHLAKNVRIPALVIGVRDGECKITPDCGDPICAKMGGCRHSPGDEWVEVDLLQPLSESEAGMSAVDRNTVFERSMGRR